MGLVATPAEAGADTAAVHRLHVIRTLSTSYLGPLQFAVTGRSVFVADAFTSTLNLIGRSKPLVTGPGDGGDVAAVAVDRQSLAVGYSTSNADHSVTNFTVRSLFHAPVVADLAGFEKAHNPDGRILYGVEHPSACVKKALSAAHIPIRYTGEVDSHPYAATALGHGSWAVADAGGNDILRVWRDGHVSKMTVLPRQALHITADFAGANHLPKCTVGVTYYFESVPTDVEVGRDHRLYATTLPGGIGVPGSVYRINPRTGHATRIATGFNSATNLAVDSRGNIYVASLGDGTISEVVHGRGVVVADLPGVVAVEWANGHLYASTAPAASEDEAASATPNDTGGPPPPGKVVILGR